MSDIHEMLHRATKQLADVVRQFYDLNQELGDRTTEIAELQAEVERLKRAQQAETALRPRWAQGFSSDSEAAQSSQIALHQIYEKLGVDDQTQAMMKLRSTYDS